MLRQAKQVGVEFEFVSVVTDPMDSVPEYYHSEGSAVAAAAAAVALLELELLGSTDSNIDW